MNSARPGASPLNPTAPRRLDKNRRKMLSYVYAHHHLHEGPDRSPRRAACYGRHQGWRGVRGGPHRARRVPTHPTDATTEPRSGRMAAVMPRGRLVRGDRVRVNRLPLVDLVGTLPSRRKRPIGGNQASPEPAYCRLARAQRARASRRPDHPGRDPLRHSAAPHRPPSKSTGALVRRRCAEIALHIVGSLYRTTLGRATRDTSRGRASDANQGQPHRRDCTGARHGNRDPQPTRFRRCTRDSRRSGSRA